MPLVAPLVLVLLGSAPPTEDVPALLRTKTEQLLDAITRGDRSVWERELHPQAHVVDEQGVVLERKAMVDSVRPLPAASPDSQSDGNRGT